MRGAAVKTNEQLPQDPILVHPSKFDEKFQDQAFNVQADISMLLDEHFEQLRDKFNGILRRNTDNLNRWITTDLAFIDKESRNVGTTVFPAGVSGPK